MDMPLVPLRHLSAPHARPLCTGAWPAYSSRSAACHPACWLARPLFRQAGAWRPRPPRPRRPPSLAAAACAAFAAGGHRQPRQPAPASGRQSGKAKPRLSNHPQHRGAASAPVRQEEEDEEGGAGGASSSTTVARGPSTFRRPPRPPRPASRSAFSRRDPDLSANRFVKPVALPKAVWEILDTLHAAGN